jgi:hypothetical protein
MRRALATAAALLLASCYDPGGQCKADADCLPDQICGPDALCIAGTRPPAGDPPVAAGDAYAFSGTGPFQVTAANGVLKNDTPPAGATITAEMVPSGTTHTSAGGTVYLAPDGSFVYATPVLGWVSPPGAPDTFTYRATDGVLSSADTTVAITVSP